MTTIPFEGELTETQVNNIKEWVASLRSGEYIQGRGMLMRLMGKRKKYCCLGVSCRIKKIDCYLKSFPDEKWFIENYGFNYSDRLCLQFNEGITLIQMNDLYKYSFDKIAKVIEAVFIDRKKIEA